MNADRLIPLMVLSIIFLVVFNTQVISEEITINITASDFTVIQDPVEETVHLLFRPEFPGLDTNAVVNTVGLRSWLMPDTQDTTFISVRFHPITTDWNFNNVTWNSPWENPGGDYDDIFYGEFTITLPIEQEVEIDLKNVYFRWLDGSLPYYGLLFKLSESSLNGVTPLVRYENNIWAKIIIDYSIIE